MCVLGLQKQKFQHIKVAESVFHIFPPVPLQEHALATPTTLFKPVISTQPASRSTLSLF